MNVLILAAGSSATALDENYPACLTEVDGVPLIERTVEACHSLEPDHFIFAIRDQDAQRYHLDNIVELLASNATVLRVGGDTAGAACTALLAAKMIDNKDDLLIMSSNELVDVDYVEVVDFFRDQKLDAGVMTFPSIHPRYSYVRMDGERVVEAAEKKPISRHAAVSFYWFAEGASFVRAAKNMIRKDAHVGGIFYIAPVLNEFVLEQKNVGIYPIEASQYHPLKTQRQMDHYETMTGIEKTA